MAVSVPHTKIGDLDVDSIPLLLGSGLHAHIRHLAIWGYTSVSKAGLDGIYQVL